jgi:hypothetical protein
MGYEQLWVLKAKLQELRELRLEHLQSTTRIAEGLTHQAA